MTTLAVRLGTKGAVITPTPKRPMIFPLKLWGKIRKISRAIRTSKPLSAIPTPKPKAPKSIQKVEPEKEEKAVSVGTRSRITNRTHMSIEVTYSGIISNTHQVIAQHKIPNARILSVPRPCAGLTEATATPIKTPASAAKIFKIIRPLN